MRNVNLLVTDRSPDVAEHINSLLRNSGIKIHVIHASTGMEVKRSLDHEAPVLILFANPDESDATLQEVSGLAEAFNVPVALYTSLETPEKLAELISAVAVVVINADDENLLIETVRKLLADSEAARNQEQQKLYLEELQHRYNLLLDSSRDAIAYIHEGLHVYTNRAYLEALQVDDESKVAAISLLEMLDTGDTDLKSLLKGFTNGKYPTKPLKVTVKRPGGSEFTADLVFSPAQFDGEECTQMMMQRSNSDTALAAEIDRLRFTDMLTRLGNRKAFVQALDSRIKDGPGSNSEAVLYIEPDGIAQLEAELPVHVLDAYISDLAGIVARVSGENDVAARISDHGFAILTSRTEASEVESLAREIIEAFRSHVFEIDDRAFSVSCSIGLTLLGRLPVSATDILQRARKAYAEAAVNGDSFISYRPELTAVSSDDENPQWVEQIKYALTNGDFYSVKQSIVDLEGDGDNLVENVTFMRGEENDHPPTEFLDIADRADLGGTIDRLVIPELLKTMAESDEQQIINLSHNSILDYSFPGWLADQMKALAVDGSKVILQIAAPIAQSNLRPAQRLMQELSPLGCRLSISRFDAELRCRQLLEHLDVSLVKMNSSLTKDLTGNSKNQEVVRSVVDAAEPHKVMVIAEEVSDTASLAVLWQCGVTLIAGAFLKESPQVLAQ